MKIDLTEIANKAMVKRIEMMAFELVSLHYDINYALGTHTKGYKHTKQSETLDPHTLEWSLDQLNKLGETLFGEEWVNIKFAYWTYDSDINLANTPIMQGDLEIR